MKNKKGNNVSNAVSRRFWPGSIRLCMKPWKYVWAPQQSISNIYHPTSHLISPAVVSLYSNGFLFFNGICVHTIFCQTSKMVPIVSEWYCWIAHLIKWLTLIQQLCLQPGKRLKFRLNDCHRSCGSRWISTSPGPKIRTPLLKSHLFSWQQPPVGHGAETLYVCWLQDLCSWREADTGSLRGFRNCVSFFQQLWLKKKRRRREKY